MPKIIVKDREHFESALRRFNRSVEKADVMDDFRKHEFYEKKSETRKRNKAAAKKRAERTNNEGQNVSVQRQRNY